MVLKSRPPIILLLVAPLPNRPHGLEACKSICHKTRVDNLATFKAWIHRRFSQRLSRWAPGFVRAIASVLQSKVWQALLLKKMHTKSGGNMFLHITFFTTKTAAYARKHVQRNHTIGGQKLPPRAGILSMDAFSLFMKLQIYLVEPKRSIFWWVLSLGRNPKSRRRRRKRNLGKSWQILGEAAGIEDGEDFANDEKSEEVVEEEKTKKKKRSERTSGQMGVHMRSFPQRIEKKWRLPTKLGSPKNNSEWMSSDWLPQCLQAIKEKV